MTDRGGDTVVRLAEKDVADVTDVLCDAFADYPVMRFILGERPAYRRDLERLIHFFVMARVHRGEFLFGIEEQGTLQAAAMVSRLPGGEMPPALTALREKTWRELGPDARARYEAYGAVAPFSISAPHLHLNMIGVRHHAHGRGYARRLLEHVHAFSRDDPGSAGVSLTTETTANLPLYRHFGYHIVGRREVSPELTTWGFYRRNDGAAKPEGLHVRRMRAGDRVAMLELWERSVRATHHFLDEADIVVLRPHVSDVLSLEAIGWWVAESPAGTPMGFMGFIDPEIAALFVDPEYFRQGAGSRLIAHAGTMATAPLRLDVNEQNEEAVRFYQAAGFRVVGRSPTDAMGRPFPLLHMQRPPAR